MLGRLGFWIDGLSDTVSVIVLVISIFHLNHRSHDNNPHNNNNNNKLEREKSPSQYDDYRHVDDGDGNCCKGNNNHNNNKRRICRLCGDNSVVTIAIDNVDNVADNDDSYSSSSSSSMKDEASLSDVDSDESLLSTNNGCQKKSGQQHHQHRLRSSSPSSIILTAPSSIPSLFASLRLYLSTRLVHRKTFMLIGVVASLSLSCTIWNNACYIYMDLLDTRPECPRKRLVQLEILKSWLSLIVFYCWRFCMPLAFILQCALAIFFDKTLAFTNFVTRVYFWFIVAISIITVAHLAEIKDVLNADRLC